MHAQATRLGGEYETGAFFEESLALNRRLDDEGMIAVESYNLGHVEIHQGNVDAAERHFGEARRLGLGVGPYGVARSEAAWVDALLAWYSENARDLPWRRTRDPYAILVSEVMLQQTQVERVVPRYEAWLGRWPTVESLAATPTAEVIRAWQGLGYNRRAVNLQRAAAQIAERGWPDDLTELPGVGRYTADAIACFALGRAVLPVDTNIRRVQERSGLVFEADAAQALMDLGATVCLARVPRCERCPLAPACPSRGRRYEPLRKQSAFAGSFREAPRLDASPGRRGPTPVGGGRRRGDEGARARWPRGRGGQRRRPSRPSSDSCKGCVTGPQHRCSKLAGRDEGGRR